MQMLEDTSIQILLASVLIGYVLGIISGLTPGVHTNNFALLLVALSPFFASFGFTPFCIAIIILSNSIAHTFLDIIPSIFLGAPEADTALAVLPGHQLLLEGRGIEAIRLSAFGSAAAVLCSLVLLLPLKLFFELVYGGIQAHIGWILLLIVLILILSEQGEKIPGMGRMAAWRYKGMAAIVFLLAGSLGVIALERQHLLSPLIELGEPSILFPLFTGLFGASQLLISLMSETSIPEQQRTRFSLPSRNIFRGVLTGSVAGSVVAFLPGVSSAVATVLARLAVKEDDPEISNNEFIVSISGVNTSNAIFALIALFTIHRGRSGAMVAVSNVLDSIVWDDRVVVLMLLVIMAVSLLAYFTTILIGDRAADVLVKLNYARLCKTILVGLTVMVLLLTGWFGIIIFITSTIIGMIPPYAKVRRSHNMGVLLLPLLLHFL